MSALRSIEQKIEGLVERIFGRAFRSRLQPVELARKLAREMDEHKTVSVSRVYVPNEYSVYLSETDRESFSSYEAALTQELAAYLTAHARSEGFSLLAEPKVTLETDADLHTGEFGIACRMVEPEPLEAVAAADSQPAPGAEPALVSPPAPQPPPEPARVYEPLAAVGGTQIMTPEQARAAGLVQDALTLVVDGRRHRISKRITTIGRSRDCDVVVADPNVSRTHAELRHVGLDYFLVDLNSTNGIEVNGQQVKRHALADGDRVLLGTTELRVQREPA
jgi:hypothetical protein